MWTGGSLLDDWADSLYSNGYNLDNMWEFGDVTLAPEIEHFLLTQTLEIPINLLFAELLVFL